MEADDMDDEAIMAEILANGLVHKRWDLERVTDAGDPNGAMIGRYLQRTDVTKALAKVAYQPEPRW